MLAADIPTQSSDAKYELVEDEAIIIDLKTGSYYSLNDTGTMFWKLIDGQRSIAACAEEIAKEYDVAASIVESDILELAEGFLSEGLIELQSAA